MTFCFLSFEFWAVLLYVTLILLMKIEYSCFYLEAMGLCLGVRNKISPICNLLKHYSEERK